MTDQPVEHRPERLHSVAETLRFVRTLPPAPAIRPEPEGGCVPPNVQRTRVHTYPLVVQWHSKHNRARIETNLHHRASDHQNKTAFPSLDTLFYLTTHFDVSYNLVALYVRGS